MKDWSIITKEEALRLLGHYNEQLEEVLKFVKDHIDNQEREDHDKCDSEQASAGKCTSGS